jgi:hypothetical protein
MAAATPADVHAPECGLHTPGSLSPFPDVWPRFLRLQRPPPRCSMVFGGVWCSPSGERPSNGGAWSSHATAGSSHPLSRLPARAVLFSIFMCFWAFLLSLYVLLPLVYPCNCCVWVLSTFNIILTTFTGGLIFWYPCQKLIGLACVSTHYLRVFTFIDFFCWVA